MKNPPILVAVIGFFGALAGFGYLFLGLRAIGFDWFGALGDLPPFEHVGLWGWLLVVTGIVWLLAAFGLWSLQPWARMFAMIVAGFGLFEATLAFFQFPGSGIPLSMALMPAIILWYLSTRDVKVAFGIEPDVASVEWTETPMRTEPDAPVAAAGAGVAAAAVDREPEPGVESAPVDMAAEAGASGAEEPPMASAARMASAAPSASVGASRMRVEDVEGIGPAYGAKLVALGILTTDDLLANGTTRASRDRISVATGISHALILEWVNNADLMRVPGVGTQYSDLLEAAGVDSPAELAHRNAADLAETFQEVVAARPGTVRRIPTESEIAAWIEDARNLPKVVEH